MDKFAEVAGKLSRNPLGIIALFIVLVYGIAGLVLGTAGKSLNPFQNSILVWFLAVFPFTVLGAFVWLVSKHHTKLYAPADFRNDEGFLRVLTPEEQKRKLEKEVQDVINEETSIDSTKSIPLSSANNNILRESVLLAEELAFREIENEYNVSINRHVSVGQDFGIDGMFAKEGRGYAIEIKYFKHRIRLPAIEHQLQSLANRIFGMGWRNVEIIIALVTENDEFDMSNIAMRLQEFGKSTGIVITPKYYNIRSLRKRYGIEGR